MMIRISRKVWLLMGVTTGLLALVFLVGRALAQGPGGDDPTTPEGGSPVSTMTYQGYLEWDGAVAHGVFDFRVSVWDAQTLGNQLGSTQVYDTPGVTVENGYFSIYTVPGDPSDVFTGGGRWIQLEVRPHGVGGYTTLPRQPITNVPYAWGLKPGAVISTTISGSSFGDAVLNIHAYHPWQSATNGLYAQSTSSSAVRAESNGIGVYSYSYWDHAVHAESVIGTAGYFHSGVGYGIRADADGGTVNDHGAYVTSNMGYGVLAESASNQAIRGWAGDNTSYSVPGGPWGVVGVGQSGGTWGSSWNNTGVYGTSGTYRGVHGNTNRGDQNYGLHTYDNLYSLNINLPGAVMHVAQNGGDEALDPGDVVVFSGISAVLEAAGVPIIQVAKAGSANSTAVAGVVFHGINIEAVMEDATGDQEVTSEGPVEPGEYLLLVVQGPAQVKASALSGAIQTGDLLSAAEQAGYAARAAEVSIDGARMALPGTVFGKALEPLDAGRDGLIYVFVILQ